MVGWGGYSPGDPEVLKVLELLGILWNSPTSTYSTSRNPSWGAVAIGRNPRDEIQNDEIVAPLGHDRQPTPPQASS